MNDIETRNVAADESKATVLEKAEDAARAVEEELVALIQRNYGSVRNFSQHISLAHSTVDSIMKRGVLNSNVENVAKICNGLNIDLELLARGKVYAKLAKELREAKDDLRSSPPPITGIQVGGSISDSQVVNTSNGSKVGIPVKASSAQGLELLVIYENLDLRRQHKLVGFALKLEKEAEVERKR